MTERTDFYVYALLDPSNGDRPFYVGKGYGIRYSHHYTPAYVARRSMKADVIRRYRALGFKDAHILLATGLGESEAFAREVEEIARLGFRRLGGLLVNAALGGQGSSGCNQPKTPEHKAAISRASKGKICSEATRAKRSALRKGKVTTPGTRAKISAALKGRPRTSEHIAALRVAAIASGKVKRGVALNLTDEQRRAIGERLLRTSARWYDVTTPDGHVKRIYNLAAFCRTYKLSNAHLGQVVLGRRRHHLNYVARFAPPEGECT